MMRSVRDRGIDDMRQPMGYLPVLLLCVLSACASGPGGGQCLFWSADCTKLEAGPDPEPLIADLQGRPAGAPLILPAADAGAQAADFAGQDLGRVRTAPSYAQSSLLGDRAKEQAFEDRFIGPKSQSPERAVYPLPADCSAPPAALLRNSPADRFAPNRNSAAASAYAQAYRRCGQPGTWPRPQ